MEKMKDAVNAAAGGDGIPTRRIAGDAGREYILQTEEDAKAKAALEAGAFPMHVWLPAKCCIWQHFFFTSMHEAIISICALLLSIRVAHNVLHGQCGLSMLGKDLNMTL